MKENGLIRLVVALALSLMAVGCDWVRSFALGEHRQIVHKYPLLTLAWNPPLSDIPNRSLEVIGYQIYYREHGNYSWRLLGEVPASANPEFTLNKSELGPGVFDFAVSSVTESGSISPLHSSLDSNADPVSGWYVLWAESE